MKIKPVDALNPSEDYLDPCGDSIVSNLLDWGKAAEQERIEDIIKYTFRHRPENIHGADGEILRRYLEWLIECARIEESHTYLTDDGHRLHWNGLAWTDGDLSFGGTLKSGPQGVDR